MWQRIQSIFLGIVIFSLVAGLFLPFGGGAISNDKDAKPTHLLYPMHFMTKTADVKTVAYMPFAITSILMVAAITIAIQEFRRFDNRILQIKLGTLNSLVLAGITVCGFIFSREIVKTYHVNWRYDLGLYLSVLAVVCNWIAMRFIRKDDKIVRDSNRLR